MIRECCPFPAKWFGILDQVPEDHIKPILRAIGHYWETGEVENLGGLLSVVLKSFIADLDTIKAYKEMQAERRRKTKANQTEPKRTEVNQSEPNVTNTNKANQTEPNGHKIKENKIKQNNPSPLKGEGDKINTPNSSPSSLGAKGEDLEREKRETEERENREMWRGIQHVQLPKGCRYDKNLGPFEYRDAEGKRRYREGGPIVPDDVEPRTRYDDILVIYEGKYYWTSRSDAQSWGGSEVE